MVRDYKQRNIPLDVLVTDMDWHITFYSQNAKDQVITLIMMIFNNPLCDCTGWAANGMDWFHVGQTFISKSEIVFGLVCSVVSVSCHSLTVIVNLAHSGVNPRD